MTTLSKITTRGLEGEAPLHTINFHKATNYRIEDDGSTVPTNGDDFDYEPCKDGGMVHRGWLVAGGQIAIVRCHACAKDLRVRPQDIEGYREERDGWDELVTVRKLTSYQFDLIGEAWTCLIDSREIGPYLDAVTETKTTMTGPRGFWYGLEPYIDEEAELAAAEMAACNVVTGNEAQERFAGQAVARSIASLRRKVEHALDGWARKLEVRSWHVHGNVVTTGVRGPLAKVERCMLGKVRWEDREELRLGRATKADLLGSKGQVIGRVEVV